MREVRQIELQLAALDKKMQQPGFVGERGLPLSILITVDAQQYSATVGNTEPVQTNFSEWSIRVATCSYM
jgi:hypothetical protein